MIIVEKLRELTVSATQPMANQAAMSHLSAASGMVIVGKSLYVVADDELHLGIFSLPETAADAYSDAQAGQCLAILPGALAIEKAERKKQKPDLETLLLLPPMAGFPQGALLALGSGSKANRQRAIIMPLDSNGVVHENIITVDVSPLYSVLRQHFADLNIEGALITKQQLVLMQRGNQLQPESALVYCPLDYFLQFLQNTVPDFTGQLTVVNYTLPTVAGVPLCFTDGVALPNGDILFSAVAESTDDSYNDGECVGAALGIIKACGQLACCELLQVPYKVEGVAIRDGQHCSQVLLVTDADNAAIPAALLRVTDTGALFKAS